MKNIIKYISIILAIFTVALAFSSCSKAEQEQTADSYYDKMGNLYEQQFDVKYYDKDGNSYHFEMDEDYFPNIINDSTGEVYNGLECYITADGYFFYDSENSLKRKKDSASTYVDLQNNEYYDISTVTWDVNGNLLIKVK